MEVAIAVLIVIAYGVLSQSRAGNSTLNILASAISWLIVIALILGALLGLFFAVKWLLSVLNSEARAGLVFALVVLVLALLVTWTAKKNPRIEKVLDRILMLRTPTEDSPKD